MPGSVFQVHSSAQLGFKSSHYRRIRPGPELRLLSASSLQVFSLLTGTARPGASSFPIRDGYGPAPTGKTRPGPTGRAGFYPIGLGRVLPVTEMFTLSVRRQEYIMKVIFYGCRCSAVCRTIMKRESVS